MRKFLLAKGTAALERTLRNLHPLSLLALLATVVGVLIEVPVMLMVVSLVKRSQGWYEKT